MDYSEISKKVEELRHLAMKRKCTVVTATQPHRGGEPSLDDVPKGPIVIDYFGRIGR